MQLNNEHEHLQPPRSDREFSRRTRWLAAITMLIGLPVLGFTIAVAIVNPNDYKPQIIAAVQQATGRALVLDGPLRISRSLWPTIEVNDVKLANLPGGTRPDMATAERIEAQLSLPSLLWRRLEVSRLTLIGPNILFEEVAHKPNWEFGVEGGEAVTPARPSGTGVTLRIRKVQVQNGMVTFRLPARTKVVGIRSLAFQHLEDGGPLEVSSVLVYSDYQPFSLQVSAQPRGGITDPWNTQLRFAAYDAIASGEGTMDLAGNYELQVAGEAPALEKLNELLPEMQLPALHQMKFWTHLTNGPVRGDLPIFGKTQLHIGSADLGDRVPGLKFGAVEASLSAAGATATVTGEASVAGQPFLLDGTVGVPELLDGPISLPIDLTARAGNAASGGQATGIAEGSLALRGRLKLNTGHFDGLDAAATLHTPALAGIRPMVSAALPALTGVSLDGRLVVPAAATSMTFHGAKLLTHEGDLAGDVTFGFASAVALDAQVRSMRLDLDALLVAAGVDAMTTSAAGTANSNAAASMLSDAPLPWAVLRGPTLNVKANVARMTFQQQDWQNVELALQLQGGRLKVDRLFLTSPGGPLTAVLSADASSDPVPAKLVLHAAGVPLALIARHADLPGRLGGNMKLDADLHAVGRSSRDLAASLDGSFAATMVGGSLSNAALLKLASASLEALSIKVPLQGETAIHCLGLIGSFRQGVGRFDTIAVDTSYLELGGVGQIDLRTETMALKLHPLAQLSGSPVSVPVLVEGPLRDPRGRLDASGLDQLGLLIDAWFGGDRPKTCADAGLVPPSANGH